MSLTELVVFIFTWVVIVALILVIKIWFWGSLFTSGVKGLSDSCGKTYGIEKTITIINGNWFCPSK